MSYTNNPNLPRVRMQAIELVNQGKSVREVARHFGFSHNAVLNWLKRKPEYGWHNQLVIPTRSSRPKHHPKELKREIVFQILSLRKERNQCAEILHHRLINEFNIKISLSSVKRTLKRCEIRRFSKWKKWHVYPLRPIALKPGILVEIDSMREGLANEGLCLYALIDTCSRWAYAKPVSKVNSWQSVSFYREAKQEAIFNFRMVQSDHGSEFAKWFSKQLFSDGINHRHSRVRKPTDNGHIERFIKTIQQECLSRTSRSLKAWQKAIPEFIHYYNTERPHMGLNYRTPMQVVRSY